MVYHVIYDGNCNLCVTLVQWLEQSDRGVQFHYVPMQNQEALDCWQITPQDCEMGMILLNAEIPEQRWQGTAAAEEIGRLLPMGTVFVNLYRSLPGVKWTGDRVYEKVRDNRYALFGKRETTYHSNYPICSAGQCEQ